ncbi:hypothetical protein [Paenibacillus protaetiae]|uniref:DUF5666 domain-containing protein n=1 Tax=Paenibacillus protaetiae TaxID=2509456 RepID=A0A4P6F0P9_9BACL|nr:hypothetical protein [Paenibacillus protaetiae]QAY68183.1 hypothetical protein ET464_19205 [Paenibacillus protaetiae]
MNNSWKVALSGALLALVLAGCGAKDDGGAAAAQGNGSGSQAAASSSAQNGRQPVRGAFGKIKSIDGNTITVYKSSFTGRERPEGKGQPPQGQNGGDQAAGQASGGTSGAGGSQSSDGSQKPDGARGQNRGNWQQGGGMNTDNMFTDETITLQVTDSTQIVKRSFENNKMTETNLSLSDLKADDIITYTLVDGSEDQLDTISVGMGGFGGGRGPGMGGRGGDWQGSGQAAGQTAGAAGSNS